ncbi:hypothetical protein ES703_68438 [subsurface metagenome]
MFFLVGSGDIRRAFFCQFIEDVINFLVELVSAAGELFGAGTVAVEVPGHTPGKWSIGEIFVGDRLAEVFYGELDELFGLLFWVGDDGPVEVTEAG